MSESNQAFVPSDLSYLSMSVQPNAARLVKSNAKQSKQATRKPWQFTLTEGLAHCFLPSCVKFVCKPNANAHS